jgi:hypothetical protein
MAKTVKSAAKVMSAAQEERVLMEKKAAELKECFDIKAQVDEQMKQLKADLMGYAERNRHLFEGKKSFVIGDIKVAEKTETTYMAMPKFCRSLFIAQYPKAVKYSFVGSEMKNIEFDKWGIDVSIIKTLEVGKA